MPTKILRQKTETFEGMSIDSAVPVDYRKADGSLTMHYLKGISKQCDLDAEEFNLALKQFFYNFPLDGKYRISWAIEKIED